ncbi:hypothetical protein EPIR_3777 [Erwinia piriflorinigrans CFBP 5888]|uniref:Uncharacterized protein n=1 Tax=Erwinia piriflorinigrans CFBP 5888 TaxID=1161919 RepID=V5ZCY8_9GAMM|nr:hypothetical protein EPIR_3777 [Erwinia piriflorinigrans CFBP 5888]
MASGKVGRPTADSGWLCYRYENEIADQSMRQDPSKTAYL